jgi:Protein of unknown function (DUF1302)
MQMIKPRSMLNVFKQTPLAAAAALVATAAGAMDIGTGDADLTIHWDNTPKYSAAVRTTGQNAQLIANPNQDDGDRNFNRGLISNRVDWLSELDVQRGDFGGRVSGAGWYDTVYNGRNDNPGFAGGAFPNQISVPYNEFTSATRHIHGRDLELLDAFAFGRFDIAGHRASLRLGQHSILWGESLFFGGNAIAGAQSPVDIVKLQSVPNTTFKEAIRPVPQVSGQIELAPQVTLGAYYQFRWAADRFAAVGSYFSQQDLLVDGAEQILLPPGLFLDGNGNAPRGPDQRAKNSGQGGLQLRFSAGETDYGLYLVRFHDKFPQPVINIGVRPTSSDAGCVGVGGLVVGPGLCAAPQTYQLAYHEGITAFGASASHTFGPINVAIEASVRHNQDLESVGSVNLQAVGGSPTNNSNNPAYMVGNTAHANLSTLWEVPSTPLWGEATFTGEIAWNRVLSITKNPQTNNPVATRDATGLRFVFEPTYRQVLSGVDIGVPFGLGYAPKWSRSMALGPGQFNDLPAGGGDWTLGIDGSYLDAWRFSLAYTRYFGPENTFLDAAFRPTYAQALKDRNFIALSLRRTF